MADIELYAGDNRTSLRMLIDQGVRVHSCVTDPPYALTSITKRFGKKESAPARRENTDGSFSRLSGGFMGMKWDATGIERDPDFWRLVYDILLPGGYVFAFSGARTGHWQAMAMELAGFVMHPMHGWVYGSGWNKPKSVKDVPGFEGWGYGTQAQKPALEPIYLGQKPFSEKTGPANIRKHGVGAVNLAGCLVPIDPHADASQLREMNRNRREDKNELTWGFNKGSGQLTPVLKADGRMPANLILDGSPEVVGLFPRQAGAKAPVKGTEPSDVTASIYGKFAQRLPSIFHGDSGSAARFFHNFSLTDEDYLRAIAAGEVGEDRADVIAYNKKAGKTDRAGSDHPTVKPIDLIAYLIRHITPPGGIVLDPFAGTATTAEAAKRNGFKCVLMEAEKKFVDFIHARLDLVKTGCRDEIGIYSSPSENCSRSKQEDCDDHDILNLDEALDEFVTSDIDFLVYDPVDSDVRKPFRPADTPRGYEQVETNGSGSGTDLSDLLCSTA